MIRILLSTRLGERRWTQADLSRATGIRAATINEMYHELSEKVSLEHLDMDEGRIHIICELAEQRVRNLETLAKAGAQHIISVEDDVKENIAADYIVKK